jgi:hypothetical protein
LNQLNIFLQGHNSFIINLYDEIFSNEGGIMSVKAQMKEGMFRILAVRPEDCNNGTGLNESLISEINLHLQCWKRKLSRYFPDISNKLFPLVKSPFTFGFDEVPEIA